SLSQAQTEMKIIARRIEEQYPQTNTGRSVRLRSLVDDVVDDYTPTFLLILLGTTAFVLLIACTNIANLQLARATGRYKEIAIRIGLGASRLQIVRQLLTESVLVSLLGGVMGLILAVWGLDVMKAAIPLDVIKYIAGFPYMVIDGRAIIVTLAIA